MSKEDDLNNSIIILVYIDIYKHTQRLCMYIYGACEIYIYIYSVWWDKTMLKIMMIAVKNLKNHIKTYSTCLTLK